MSNQQNIQDIIHDLTKCEIKTMAVLDEHYDENGLDYSYGTIEVVIIPMKQPQIATLKAVDSISCENNNYDHENNRKRRIDYIFSDKHTTVGKKIIFHRPNYYRSAEQNNIETIFVKLGKIIYAFDFGKTSVFIRIKDDSISLNAHGYIQYCNNDETFVYRSLETFEEISFVCPKVQFHYKLNFKFLPNGKMYAKYCDPKDNKFNGKLYSLEKKVTDHIVTFLLCNKHWKKDGKLVLVP